METGYDVEIIPRNSYHTYQVFDYTPQDVMEPVMAPPIYEHEDKPLIFFLQHKDPGNIKVLHPPKVGVGTFSHDVIVRQYELLLDRIQRGDLVLGRYTSVIHA